jgi:hypothetical protein
MNVAPSLVHPNQVRFMKRRKIEDQIKLAKFLLNYGEAAEKDGIIVALDQEKVYDRINHSYSLMVLEHMGFPPKFRTTVEAFYTNAETVVIINAEMSDPYRVIRGVRQGDPLSCLLFNLVVEPLACLIRNSSLKAIKIPRKDEDLIIHFSPMTQLLSFSLKTQLNLFGKFCTYGVQLQQPNVMITKLSYYPSADPLIVKR